MADIVAGNVAERETTFEIEDAIRRVFDSRALRVRAHGPHFAKLWELASRCMSGGKLLRPRILIGAFDALSDRGSAAAARVAALELSAALEILHFSFLLHDDIIDEDLLRRGEPNIVGHLAGYGDATMQPEPGSATSGTRRLHWARSSGILVGDLMLSVAHQIFARVRVPEDHRLRMLDLLDATIAETVAGEHYDVGLADGCIEPDLTLVLDMTRMKTAAYTFELPLRIASVVADADPIVEQHLGTVGRHLGFAFQLQDDLLSAFGESEAHGKDQFSDFREKKETALIAYARMTQVWPSLEPLLGEAGFTDDSGHMIQRMLIESGARAFIESMVQDQIRAAVSILSAHDDVIPTSVLPFMLTFIDMLDGRRA